MDGVGPEEGNTYGNQGESQGFGGGGRYTYSSGRQGIALMAFN